MDSWRKYTEQRLRRVEKVTLDRDQYEREVSMAEARQRRLKDRRITRKIVEINGKASRIPGVCERCGEPHGTVKVERITGGTFTICPIAYWLRRWMECLHSGTDAGKFIEEHPIERVLAYDTTSNTG